MCDHYIYVYYTRQGSPFYVGKGKGKRFEVVKHIQKGVSNKFLKNTILKLGKENIVVALMHQHSTEDEVIKWERYWIKFFGRKDLGLGTLCNLTAGGEGVSGAVRSPELRAHLSAKVKEAWAKLGGHSLESRQKMIIARTGSKRSEETKRRMSEAAKLRFQKSGGYSQEVRDKISKKNKGKPGPNKGGHLSAEVKLKLSIAKRNAGLPSAFKGRFHSEESKRKMSETKRLSRERRLAQVSNNDNTANKELS